MKIHHFSFESLKTLLNNVFSHFAAQTIRFYVTFNKGNTWVESNLKELLERSPEVKKYLEELGLL